MTSLVEIVRTKTGATEAEVTDARIVEALEDTSVPIDGLRVVWGSHPDGSATRVGKVALAKYVVEATGAAGSVDAPVLASSAGVVDSTMLVTRTGFVTTTVTSGALPTVYATGRAYDVNAAAADVVEELLVLEKSTMDFKRGDQTFNRGDVVDNLEAILRRLRAKSIPRRRGETVMRDQAASARWSF